MSENKKLVPKRRFKEFQNADAWKQCELGAVADKFDNLRVPITARDRVSGSIPYYGANGIQDYVEDFTHDGEFVLLAEDGANDLADYPVQYVNGKVWVNNHAHVLSGKEDILDNRFLMNSLKQINIEPYLVGGGRAKLNADVMMRLTLKITSIDEQVKIGEFFTNLDQTIAFQQRKLEKMKSMKSAYLSEMFPAEGEFKPKRRFPGFTDAWEQRELGEVIENVTDYVAAGSFASLRENVVYKSYPDYAQLVRTADLKSDFNNASPVYVDKRAFDFLYRVDLSKESIVLPNIGNCGEVYYISPDQLPYERNVLGPNAILVRSDSSSNKFLSILFQGENFQEKLKLIVSPNGQTKFNKTELKQIQLIFPNDINEQNQIGQFFSNLDQTIAFQQQKLEKLQNIKKAYLNEMFI